MLGNKAYQDAQHSTFAGFSAPRANGLQHFVLLLLRVGMQLEIPAFLRSQMPLGP